MSEKKWTEGPWIYHTDGDSGVYSGYADMPVICQAPISKQYNEEWHANAHLIAAAPELYKALHQILSSTHPDVQLHPDHIYEAHMALAKARGEE